MTFEATMFLWLHIHYLIEEISTWRAGELQRLAVNTRYLVGHSVIRQQWDDFQRAADGLQAYRVQAKTLADLRRRHPRLRAALGPLDIWPTLVRRLSGRITGTPSRS
jgi:hypothetical protein